MVEVGNRNAWTGAAGLFYDGYSGADIPVRLNQNEDGKLIVSGEQGFGPFEVLANKTFEVGDTVVLNPRNGGPGYGYEITQIKPQP